MSGLIMPDFVAVYGNFDIPGLIASSSPESALRAKTRASDAYQIETMVTNHFSS